MTKSIYTQQIVRSLYHMKVHRPTDNMPLLLKKGYAILDDKNLHIKMQKQIDNDISETVEIKIISYNKK